MLFLDFLSFELAFNIAFIVALIFCEKLPGLRNNNNFIPSVPQYYIKFLSFPWIFGFLQKDTYTMSLLLNEKISSMECLTNFFSTHRSRNQHRKKNKFTYATALKPLIIFFISLNFFVQMDINQLVQGFISIKDRGWPPIKIYHYHMPSKFNKDLINANPSLFLNETSMEFHFAVEAFFTEMLHKTPLLTNNIKEADFIYLDIFPTYIPLNTEHQFYLKSFAYPKEFLHVLKTDHLLSNKNLFTIKAYPFEEIRHYGIPGFKAALDKLWFYPNDFIIPYYVSNTTLPFDPVNPTSKRNITIFLSASPIEKRKLIFKEIEKIPNHYTIKISRKNWTDMELNIAKIPYFMTKSKYCVVPRGDSPSSKRLYESMLLGCVPVIISKGLEIAFETTQVDWKKCTIQIPENKINTLPEVISKITDEEYEILFDNLMKAREYIRFDKGVTPDTAVGSILWELYYTKQKVKKNQNLIYIYEKLLQQIGIFKCKIKMVKLRLREVLKKKQNKK